jgi:hypothetical protein
MRPEPPARYRRSIIELPVMRYGSNAARMVVRNIERQPFRAAASVVVSSATTGKTERVAVMSNKAKPKFLFFIGFRLSSAGFALACTE